MYTKDISILLYLYLHTDPMWYKYPHLSPYAYCADNPVMLVDPDGRKIRFAKGVSPEFKAAFKEAIQHLNKHNVGHIAAALENVLYCGD